MTPHRTHDRMHDEFLDVAVQAMDGAADPLGSLGWWELLDHLDDPDARVAAFAALHAQGRTLAETPAVGGLVAQPYLAAAGLDAGTAVAAVVRSSPRRGDVLVVAGDPGGRSILVDRPGHGVGLAGPGTVELRPIGAGLAEATVDRAHVVDLLDESATAPRRAQAAALGRIALGHEILGAAEGAAALATQHAVDREQFGEPIGRFQAVRHLLAWAKTDCEAVAALARQVVDLGDAAPPRYDEVLKALAGRNGRKACERALQVLGGIGFTDEHDHHRHHARVLALDAVLGSSAAVTRDLGTWLRASGQDPRYPTAVLAAG